MYFAGSNSCGFAAKLQILVPRKIGCLTYILKFQRNILLIFSRLQDYENGAVIKKEDEDENEEETEQKELTMKEKLKKLAEEEKKNQTGPKRYKVDTECPYYHGAQIVDDYDCMLNQTNIGANNNKFYIIQLFNCAGSYFVWNRWGRVVSMVIID